MWDFLFDSSVPFVFQTPFQSAPMDLWSPFFYLNRKNAIDAFVDDIEAGRVSPVDVLQRQYEANFQCQGPGVRWESYPLDMLCQVVQALSRASLARLILYAATNYRAFGKGMPDLCLWKADKLFICEVKGPRDRLSPEQEAHLLMLNRMGITAIVTHVEEAKEEAVDEEEEGEEEEEEEEEEDDLFL